MRGTTRTVATVAGISAAALLSAACGGGNSGEAASTTAAGKTGGSITVRGCNPQNPLVPGNTNETCGGNVLDASTAKLVHYNPETAAPENDIAESIETDGQPELHRQAQEGLQVPGRHRGQGQELRRRLELGRDGRERRA